MRHRALVLGGVPDVLEVPRDLGIEVIFFQRAEGMKPELEELADEIQVAPFGDDEAMVAQAVEAYGRRPFDCVLSFSELAMIPAAMIGERLSVPGASAVSTARLLRDKRAMRDRLNSAGLSPVRNCLVHSVDDARAFAETAGYPLILKPRDGTGSLGVRRVDSAGDLASAVREALAVPGPELLLEEFLAGPEFSVEAFSFAGAHRVIAVTEKQITANFVESGHIVPARISDSERAAIVSLVESFLDLARVSDGPSHTEVILSDGVPRIVESHDRLGGDKIFRLVELAYGVSLLSWCYQWPLRMMTVPAAPAPVAGGCIRYLLPEPGQVRSVSVPDSVTTDKHLDHLEIEVSAGDQIRPLSSSLDRAGFVVASGPDAQAAIEAAERLAGTITIETVPVPA
jgi:biotin carboxylase